MSRKSRPSLKVGELARRSSVSVRTLHYYDEIGLLSPSDRSLAGHRLYSRGDVERLQQIKSLQQIGFSLAEVGTCLGQAEFSARRVLSLHVEALRKDIESRQRLCRLLETIAGRVGEAKVVSTSEFLEAIKEMTMMEKLNKYYTPEQKRRLAERAKEFGPQMMKQAEADWRRVIAAARAAMDAGKDPASDEVVAIAKEWRELIQAFTGSDAGIERSLGRAYQQEPELRQASGLDEALFIYVGKATAFLGQSEKD